MDGAILTLNAGSSSLKFGLFDGGQRMMEMLRGEVEDMETMPHLRARDLAGAVLMDRKWSANEDNSFAAVLDALLDFVDAHPGHVGLAAVGHRVVHGGADHVAPERVTPELLDALTALLPLDPIHMPHNIAPMRAVSAARPEVTQVAAFDTAFHHTLPLVARTFALPRALTAAGVRRYGFHGLSYEYVARRLREQAPALVRGRVIVAHLGSGASLCALHDGVSIATTFGLSVLDGLVMATRCGSLDPGVILYLARQGHGFAEIEDILYKQSGLLGVSGISGDIRVLLASDAPQAREAIELFTYRIALEAGAMASALGGLDGFVFTAGIGEHSAPVRAAVCERLRWLGLRVDDNANAVGADRISAPDSGVEIRVIPTDEELMIARHTRATMAKATAA